ncbi:hypothetical protein ESY86_07405 [Subsaximicrobium wynnwilliamsii]|uniref:Uncharacterized protein n=1 Tax=Subsaximicrobium wynnwilliamsii TaxID=291179 RepID=A0A5C6ZKB7_9FLAO|nr:hypothetical protein [Subsaximicrobium wynnwilliamsii]TXD83864.1 hypothetical protein ESY87_07565 [Subsaximicrobium wynnwilliamsii]TXD89605.1 hypothetical protein ESY86_07405 [Subsaximicrobium wynnwilliamsii]TXE02604.1 hypothetical protein ESY88_11440 [Subsaximicrobium wynnwilliamsii]
MAYKKLKPHKIDEATREIELRQLWKVEYCDNNKPVFTHDGIEVSFYEDMFDHCFFESAEWKEKDKSILSLNRLEKMLWIKDTLSDISALMKQGWDRNKKRYVNNRRVNFVKDGYIVVISINKSLTKARFITAFEFQNDEKKQEVLNSPDWIREKKA